MQLARVGVRVIVLVVDVICLMLVLSARVFVQAVDYSFCEGCLVVRSGHGPQAEVAQGVGPQPLVEL